MGSITQITIKVNAEGLQQAKSDADSLEQSLEKIDNKQVTPKVDMAAAQKSFSQLKSGVFGFADKVTSTAFKVGGALAAVVGGLSLKDIIQEGKDFEQQMHNTFAVMNPEEKTNDNFKALEDQAKSLGEQTVFTLKEVATAQTELVKAGFNTQQTMSALPGLLSMASAGELDLERATTIAASSLRMFGLETDQTQRVADVLSYAANATSADVEGLGYAMKYAGSYAHAANYSFEEATGALAMLTNYGLDASTAGTVFRGTMKNIIAPTDKASKELDRLGLKFTDNSGNVKHFATIIDELNNKTKKMSQADRLNSLSKIFDSRALTGVLSMMTAGGDAIRDMENKLKKSQGSAAETAAEKLNTIEGQWKLFQSKMSGAKISIFEEMKPIIKDVLSYANDKIPVVKDKLVNVIRFLKDNVHAEDVERVAGAMKNFVLACAGLSAIGKVDSLFTGISGIVKGFAGVEVGSIAALAAPIASVAGSVMLLGGSFLYLNENSKNFKLDMKDTFSGITEEIERINTSLGDLGSKFNFSGLIDGGAANIGSLFHGIGEAIREGLNFIADSLSNAGDLVDGISTYVQGFGKIFTGDLLGGAADIKKGFTGVRDAISKEAMDTMELISNEKALVGSTVMDMLTQRYSATAPSIQKDTRGMPGFTSTADIKETMMSQIGSENQNVEINFTPRIDENGVGIVQNALSNVKAEAQDTSMNVSITETGGQQTITTASGVKNAVTTIPNSHSTAISQSGGEGVIGVANAVASAINSIPNVKNVVISVTQSIAGAVSSGIPSMSGVGNVVGVANTIRGIIGKNALGTSNWRGGVTLVGENGPELVNLPYGTEITNARETDALLNKVPLIDDAKPTALNNNNSVSQSQLPPISINVHADTKEAIVKEVNKQLNASLDEIFR